MTVTASQPEITSVLVNSFTDQLTVFFYMQSHPSEPPLLQSGASLLGKLHLWPLSAASPASPITCLLEPRGPAHAALHPTWSPHVKLSGTNAGRWL